MRRFGILGLWIRSALVGPLAILGFFLAVYLLLYWFKRRKTGSGFPAIPSVLALALFVLALCFPYPAYLLQLPLLRWSQGIVAQSRDATDGGAGGQPTVVFVLGGGISTQTSVPSSYSLARIDHGLRVLQDNGGGYLLFSDGGLGRSPNGGEWMRRYLARAGVPGDRILLEEDAGTTQQNFQLGKRVLQAAGLGQARVVLVTSALHVPRAYHTARRYGFDPEVDPLQDGVELAFHPSWFSLLHFCAALNEYLGIAGYWVFGWL
jgi:uncharacterized SAM-binding protein YcdF (DUF218 family)